MWTSPSETSSSDNSWRRSYAKREAAGSRHRKGKLHKASRHRSTHASRGHGKAKYALVRKHKKSRPRG